MRGGQGSAEALRLAPARQTVPCQVQLQLHPCINSFPLTTAHNSTLYLLCPLPQSSTHCEMPKPLRATQARLRLPLTSSAWRSSWPGCR